MKQSARPRPQDIPVAALSTLSPLPSQRLRVASILWPPLPKDDLYSGLVESEPSDIRSILKAMATLDYVASRYVGVCAHSFPATAHRMPSSLLAIHPPPGDTTRG